MTPDPHKFYVYRQGNELVPKTYHRGNCTFLRKWWGKLNCTEFDTEQEAKHADLPKGARPRQVASDCADALPDVRPCKYPIGKVDPELRVEPKSRFWVAGYSTWGHGWYHENRECAWLLAELGCGTRTVGEKLYRQYSSQKDATYRSVDGKGTRERARPPCLSFSEEFEPGRYGRTCKTAALLEERKSGSRRKFYVSNNHGAHYHEIADCDLLIDDMGGNPVHGFSSEERARTLRVDHKTPLETPRKKCPSFNDPPDRQRAEKTCANGSEKPKPAKKNPIKKPAKGSRTLNLSAWSTVWLIKPEVGEGATNLKHYAFEGAFFGRDKARGMTMVKKVAEAGFSEKWLVKLPVTIELTGELVVKTPPKSTPNDNDQEIDERNRIVISGKRGADPVIKRLRVSGLPAAVGPSKGRLLYNSAGAGEAHGGHGEMKYAAAGKQVVLEGRPLRSGTITKPALLRIVYLYRFNGEKAPSASFAFDLLLDLQLTPYDPFAETYA